MSFGCQTQFILGFVTAMGLKGFVLISSLLFALLGVWVYIKFIKTEPSPVFQLKDGKVQGIRLKSREGRDFYAFYGLPFAKPPIGELRFEVRRTTLTSIPR